MSENLPTWELLSKQMIWKQLGSIHNKKILDFEAVTELQQAFMQRIMK